MYFGGSCARDWMALIDRARAASALISLVDLER